MTVQRRNWTIPEGIIAAGCTLLGLGALGLGFTGIYITIVPLLEPWWHWFSPLYLGTGEGSFAFAYLGWLLLTMRDDPPRRLVAGLLAYLGFFAAASLALCAYASAGNFANVVSHVALCVAFFGAGIFAKVLVHRLGADPSRRKEESALRDARQYATDLLRARLGPLWRFRCPSLLRRQVTTGRLCDAVREDVTMKVSMGRTSGWEKTVREWVLGPDGLNLAAQAEQDARKAAETIARASVPDQSAAAALAPSGTTVPATAPRQSRTVTGNSARKPSRAAVRKMTGTELADYVATLLDDNPALSRADVMEALHVGRPKAEQALATAQDRRRKSLVTAAR